MVLLLAISMNLAYAESSKDVNAAKEGKKLHSRILARYPKLDKFYLHPDLYGALTFSPKVTIYLPISEWEKLTTKDRDLLAAYVASLIKIVKSNPLKYARVPSHAPLAPDIRSNASRMTASSWQIMAGQLSADKRDIMADSVVRAGK
jgi:hypothetical protein